MKFPFGSEKSREGAFLKTDRKKKIFKKHTAAEPLESRRWQSFTPTLPKHVNCLYVSLPVTFQF